MRGSERAVISSIVTCLAVFAGCDGSLVEQGNEAEPGTARSELDPALHACLLEFESCVDAGSASIEMCALELLACGRDAVDAGLGEPLTIEDCEILADTCSDRGYPAEICERGLAECEAFVEPPPSPPAGVDCEVAYALCIDYGFSPMECGVLRADCEGAGGAWPTTESCARAADLCLAAGHPATICDAVRAECERFAVVAPEPPPATADCDWAYDMCVGAGGFRAEDCADVRALCEISGPDWPEPADCDLMYGECIARGYPESTCDLAHAVCLSHA